MKNLILSLTFVFGLSSINAFSISDFFTTELKPGQASYEWIQALNKEQVATNIPLIRAFIQCKHAPMWSTLGALYFGGGIYAILTQIEQELASHSPETLAKMSPRMRQLLKLITSGSFGLLGAWLSAIGYQNMMNTGALQYHMSLGKNV